MSDRPLLMRDSSGRQREVARIYTQQGIQCLVHGDGTIDHIDDGGTFHRRDVFRWEFDSDTQVLSTESNPPFPREEPSMLVLREVTTRSLRFDIIENPSDFYPEWEAVSCSKGDESLNPRPTDAAP